RNRRQLRCRVVELRNGEVLQVLLREYVDADGNVLQVLLALARRDDDFLQPAAGSIRRRRHCGGARRGDTGERRRDREPDSGARGQRRPAEVIGGTNLGSWTHALLPVTHCCLALFTLARAPLILATGALSQRSFN